MGRDGGVLGVERGDKSLPVFVDLRAKTKYTLAFTSGLVQNSLNGWDNKYFLDFDGLISSLLDFIRFCFFILQSLQTHLIKKSSAVH